MAKYIDADIFEVFGYTSQDGTFDDGVQFVLEKLDEQPTADVVEVMHGEWIDKGEDYMIRWTCSNCGRRDTHIYNFCPDCGADMRGGTE